MPKREPRMVPLGYGKYVRADRVFAVVPLEAGDRGEGRRTYVHVEGLDAADRRLSLRAGDPHRRRGGADRGRRDPAAPTAKGRPGGTVLVALAAARAATAASRQDGSPLDLAFFNRSVHDVARDLIGCTVIHGRTGGVIVETESYHADDEACHAFGGRTARNSPLFGPPGHAYVYFSYGIHSLLNFVAEPEGSATAVLIRALEPSHGVDLMRKRRGVHRLEHLCSGPGKLTQALGVGLGLNGSPLVSGPILVLGPAAGSPSRAIVTAPRVGITKATDLPWRFCAADSRFVSSPRPR